VRFEGESRVPKLDRLLQYLKENDGSDLHLSAGLQPRIREKGKIRLIEGEPVLGDEALRGMLREIASPRAWQEFEATRDLDFAYGIEGMARFRANYFVQNQGAAAVFRIIPEEIISVEKLGLSEAIAGLADLNQGLVLVTGPTGSGKSTTLASIIDQINGNRPANIIYLG
jgi:twitching motility protein PilT